MFIKVKKYKNPNTYFMEYNLELGHNIQVLEIRIF